MDPKIKEITDSWFQFAENDLSAALRLSSEFSSITCFHCQQAAEKYIKGLLIYRQIDFRKSHDLSYLLELLNKNGRSGLCSRVPQCVCCGNQISWELPNNFE